MERFLRYFKDPESLTDSAAREIASLVVEAVEARGRAAIALAGGSSPKPVYRCLAELPGIPWEQVDVFHQSHHREGADHEPGGVELPPEAVAG